MNVHLARRGRWSWDHLGKAAAPTAKEAQWLSSRLKLGATPWLGGEPPPFARFLGDDDDSCGSTFLPRPKMTAEPSTTASPCDQQIKEFVSDVAQAHELRLLTVMSYGPESTWLQGRNTARLLRHESDERLSCPVLHKES